MKKLIYLLPLLPILAFSQPNCENQAALGISYILPKGISVEGVYFAKKFNAGIGISYTLPSTKTVKQGMNDYEVENNSLDIFAYAGYKLVQIDYLVSAYLNAGYTMGNIEGLQPFVSSKILFPAGQKAFSIEPFYIFNRGFGGRATVYIGL